MISRTPSGSPTLDPAVTRRLRRVARRLRGTALSEGVARVVGLGAVAAFVQFALDSTLRGLEWSMRAALLGVIVVCLLLLAWRRIVQPMRCRIRLADVAHLIERRHPHLSSHLVSAVRFSAGEVGSAEVNSRAMMASVVRSAGEQARSLDFDAVVDPRRRRRSLTVLTLVLLVALSVTFLAPDSTALWFARNVLLREVPWPRRTELIVNIEGEELLAARGDDVLIEGVARGVQPREVDVLAVTPAGRFARETMVTVGSPDAYRYRHTFRDLREDFAFHLEGGDDRTDPIHVRLTDRPRVTRTELRVTPPGYTGLSAVTLGDGERSASMLVGSEVTIAAETNKPIVSAVLMSGDEPIVQASRDDGLHIASVMPVRTTTYHYELLDEDGFQNRQPVRIAVRIVKDEPPHVRMRVGGAGDMITPDAVLPVEVECADAYGLATVELTYQVLREGEQEQRVPLPSFIAGAKRFSARPDWSASASGATPGDRVTLLVRASDLNDVTGPGLAQSPDLTLRVVTAEELLAELARREQGYRVDFERFVESQDDLRGQTLSAAARLQTDRADDAEAMLAPLERRQRDLTSAVRSIRQQFEQILTELRINELDTTDEVMRLEDRIIAPLGNIARAELTEAADTIRKWARSASVDDAAAVDALQARAAAEMRGVLANMLQWEGYYEVVTMLREIIRLQKELRRESEQVLLDQAGGVFDD